MAQEQTPAETLKIGYILPILEGWMAGDTAGWSDLAAQARTAEAVGFDSLWIPDHLLYRFEGLPPFGIWECWSLVSAVAAITERIEIGTIVAVTSFRNPALFAKMVDTADEISDGRLILGLGPARTNPNTPPSATRGKSASATSTRPSRLSTACYAPARSTSRARTTPPASANCVHVGHGRRDRPSWSGRAARACCG